MNENNVHLACYLSDVLMIRGVTCSSKELSDCLRGDKLNKGLTTRRTVPDIMETMRRLKQDRFFQGYVEAQRGS